MFKNIKDIYELNKKLEENEVVFGHIKIDDLPFLLENQSQIKDFEILSIVSNSLSEYFQLKDVYFKNISKDLFLFVTRKKTLDFFIQDQFSILDKVKEIGESKGIDLSLSIGIGVGKVLKNDLNLLSQRALKKAEARSGDQVVINTFEQPFQYFGGKKLIGQKSIKNKIKKFSKKLLEEIDNAKKIIVMGHKFPDFDAIASSLALVSIAKQKKENVKFVVDLKKIGKDIKVSLESILSKEYIQQNIISPNRVFDFFDEETLIIVVDTSNALRVEVPELISKTKKIIILDHHRVGDDIIDDKIIAYIDPDATSTSEIIVEIVELNNLRERLTNIEINLLYIGIMLDSNNFKSSKLSYSTFKSASILKLWGANHIEANNFLKKTKQEIEFIYQKINKSTEIKKGIYFVIVDERKVEISTLAKIGDEFVEILDVKAVFVFGESLENDVLVSSRSNGTINVQIIMEKFYGGGHYSAAATKISKDQCGSMENVIKEFNNYIIKKNIGE